MIKISIDVEKNEVKVEAIGNPLQLLDELNLIPAVVGEQLMPQILEGFQTMMNDSTKEKDPNEKSEKNPNIS